MEITMLSEEELRPPAEPVSILEPARSVEEWAHILTRERLSRFIGLEDITLIVDSDEAFSVVQGSVPSLLKRIRPVFRLFRGRGLKAHLTRVELQGYDENCLAYRSLLPSSRQAAQELLQQAALRDNN